MAQYEHPPIYKKAMDMAVTLYYQQFVIYLRSTQPCVTFI